MSMMGERKTRDQVIAIIGADIVAKLDSVNCEPTSRAYDHDDGEIEWSASLPTEKGCVTAYYYTNADDAAKVEENGGDWGGIDWTVDHYTID
jgi:hypothetical protein